MCGRQLAVIQLAIKLQLFGAFNFSESACWLQSRHFTFSCAHFRFAVFHSRRVIALVLSQVADAEFAEDAGAAAGLAGTVAGGTGAGCWGAGCCAAAIAVVSAKATAASVNLRYGRTMKMAPEIRANSLVKELIPPQQPRPNCLVPSHGTFIKSVSVAAITRRPFTVIAAHLREDA